ncbi:hypothetical protein DY245_10060 [Streptomyces inhibens]|uniref:Uncharacterized protein n=1 Tax=Streptomyces inhibens TaxID=2293571 RepID=A0A371Q711_STRIH|nr:hypothetical protein DY245_10060 [Streptomyces inhibens]
MRRNFFRCAFGHDLTPRGAACRAEIDDPVGGADDGSTSTSCSMTGTVLPKSRSRHSTSIGRVVSAGCRPMGLLAVGGGVDALGVGKRVHRQPGVEGEAVVRGAGACP